VGHVCTQAFNPNKAVLVFTDGKDTDGSWTLDNLISYARARNVKLFTLGLSNSVDFKVLNRMARETGGAMTWASDARQLVSMHGSLGAILRGSITFYQTRWSVTSTDGSPWTNGSLFSTGIYVNTPAGTLAAPIHVEVGMPSGVSPTRAPARESRARCVAAPVKDGTKPRVCLAG
jgi:hypothetical protein